MFAGSDACRHQAGILSLSADTASGRIAACDDLSENGQIGFDTEVSLRASQTPVYFTLDLDCLDPAAFPGTGTPEAGGVSFAQLLEAILAVSQTKVVGADVNELAPLLDPSGASTALACKVVRELILALVDGNPKSSKE